MEDWNLSDDTKVQMLWNRLKSNWGKEWDLQAKTNSTAIQAPQITDKQKELIRDCFASVANRRISFQASQRIQNTLGTTSHLPDSFRIADAVIYPINSSELQSILKDAAQNDILVQVYTDQQIELFPEDIKQKHYCIVHLDLLQKVIQLDEGKFSITVQTGMTIGKLQEILNKKGWELPIQTTSISQLTVYESLLTRADMYHHVLAFQANTVGGTIAIQEGNNSLRSLFLNSRGMYGAISEVTFQIQPVPQYKRKVTALLPNFKAASKILNDLKLNQISSSEMLITHTQDMLEISDFPVEELQQTKPDFLNLIKKKSEEIFTKEKEDVKREVLLSLTLNEYQYNISATLKRVKDIIVENEGVACTFDLQSPWVEWSESFSFIAEQSKSFELDTFHFQARVPLDNLEGYYQVIKNKVHQGRIYTQGKARLAVFYSKSNHTHALIDIYVVAHSAYRRKPSSHLELKSFFEELLGFNEKQETTNPFEQKIWELIKKETESTPITSDIPKSLSIFSSIKSAKN